MDKITYGVSDFIGEPQLNNFDKLKEINPALYDVVDKAIGIMLAKNEDYAGKGDFYRNFRRVENLGIPAWKGILVRLEDKFSRVENYVKNGTFAVKDESFVDTLIDIVNYFLLTIGVYLEDKKNGT